MFRVQHKMLQTEEWFVVRKETLKEAIEIFGGLLQTNVEVQLVDEDTLRIIGNFSRRGPL